MTVTNEDTFLSTNNEDTFLSTTIEIRAAPPKYDCPIHGKTDAVIFVTVKKRERTYCVECWDEHLMAHHLPVLRERELD